jgi:4-amino-4-deoxy-L-arabinose transferase-like glycosyltransferase
MDTKSSDEAWLASHFDPGGPKQDSGFLRKRPVPHLMLLAFLFVIALAIRIHYLDASRHVAEVQFRAALIARAYFFNMEDSIPDWRREANINSLQGLRHKEPSIMEFAVALIYRFVGREDLRIPRALASVLWLVGGIFLYKIAKGITSRNTAVISTAYYLFVPVGVIVSTSFQPDPLMIMVFIISIYTILRHDEQPSPLRLAIAATVSALAILVKPLVLFAISGAFVALAIHREGSFKRAVDRYFVIYSILSLLPTGLYYGHGILAGGSLATQAEVSFLPQLWLSGDYWREWMLTATSAVGLTPFLAALIGVPMSRSGAVRALLTGLWGGYVVFCLVFSYHIRFAGYYHLQLIPIIALSFAPLGDLFLHHVKRLFVQWYWFLPVFGALLLLALFTFREIRGTLSSCAAIESEEVSREIGDIVNHSNKTVYIASYYGRPLEYYGEMSGSYWPRSVSDTDRALGRGHERSIEERLDALGFTPEYFVIADFQEFDNHHGDLKEYLADNCALIAENAQYFIYGACSNPS